jgi:uncharacterized protein YcfJ
MFRSNSKTKFGAFLMAIIFMLATLAPTADAQRRYYRHHYQHRPSKSKHIAIGTAAGAVGGALIGGGKGAIIGAGAGAATGYGVYKYKKHKRRHY